MFAPRFLTSVLVLTWAAAAPASAATITTYSTSASFNLATNGLFAVNTAINFDADTSCVGCITFTDSGVTFTGTGDSNPLTVGTVGGWGSGNVLKRTTGGGSLSAAISAGNIYAFTVSIVGVFPGFSGDPLELFVTSGGAPADYSLTAAATGGSTFFGATSDSPITNVQLVADVNTLTMGADDLTLYTQATQIQPVPEASTLVLIGTGLFLLGLCRRRAGAAVLSLFRRPAAFVPPAGCAIAEDGRGA
jgi:hypothetical protein